MYGEQALWYSTDESVTWYNTSGGKFGSVCQNFKCAYLFIVFQGTVSRKHRKNAQNCSRCMHKDKDIHCKVYSSIFFLTHHWEQPLSKLYGFGELVCYHIVS